MAVLSLLDAGVAGDPKSVFWRLVREKLYSLVMKSRRQGGTRHVRVTQEITSALSEKTPEIHRPSFNVSMALQKGIALTPSIIPRSASKTPFQPCTFSVRIYSYGLVMVDHDDDDDDDDNRIVIIINLLLCTTLSSRTVRTDSLPGLILISCF